MKINPTIFNIETEKEMYESISKKEVGGIPLKYGDVFRVENIESKDKWVLYAPKKLQYYPSLDIALLTAKWLFL